ncbi:MAG: YmdB family metallophosphoesterase, partial [Thermoanaerobaculia bacterium]|nr:YmdB family metallophosphoesterase [Thermoanaerobaculia bacterium]
MRILFVGDVIGRPGRRAVREMLPGLVDRHEVDFTIINVENAAGGFGITEKVLDRLAELPVDCFTSGNHIWDKKEGLPLLDERANLLRPANYPEGNPGHGVYVGETAAGIPLAVLNLECQVFMKTLASPFTVGDRLLAELPE